MVQQDIMRELCVPETGQKEEECLDHWRGCVMGSTSSMPKAKTGGRELLKVIFQTKAGKKELKVLDPSLLKLVKAFKVPSAQVSDGEILPADDFGKEKLHDGLQINSWFDPHQYMRSLPDVRTVPQEKLGFQSGQKMIVNSERDGKSFVTLDKPAHYTTTMWLLGRERRDHYLIRNWLVPTSTTRLLASCS